MFNRTIDVVVRTSKYFKTVFNADIMFSLQRQYFLQIVNPNNKDIRDIPGLAPPAPTRRLLYVRTGEHFT